MLALLQVLLAFLFGRRAQQAADQTQSVEAMNATAIDIARAEARAPADRAAVADSLRDGSF